MKINRTKIRLDMTPFVDVAFLLLVFFVWLHILQKPSVISMAVPDRNIDSDPSYEYDGFTGSHILYLYLGKNDKIFYTYDIDTEPDELKETDFKNIRHILFFWKLKNKWQHPLVIIKSTRHATYKNIVDIFDEMAICQNRRYAFLSDNFTISEREKLKVIL